MTALEKIRQRAQLQGQEGDNEDSRESSSYHEVVCVVVCVSVHVRMCVCVCGVDECVHPCPCIGVRG